MRLLRGLGDADSSVSIEQLPLLVSPLILLVAHRRRLYSDGSVVDD